MSTTKPFIIPVDEGIGVSKLIVRRWFIRTGVIIWKMYGPVPVKPRIYIKWISAQKL